jgi:hypothetical protein
MLKNKQFDFLRSARLYSRSEVLRKPCPVPSEPGVYAWFFRDIPVVVPVEGCLVREDLTLLYVGISPKAPNRAGKASPQRLRDRVRYHYQGNAEGSTLRLSLGCLLRPDLEIQLRRVGSGRRMTFTPHGEEALSDWMSQNALVAWVAHDEPWILEEDLINSISLPLNIQGNSHHPFQMALSAIRSDARTTARDLRIADS